MNNTDSLEGLSVEALVSEVTDEFMKRLERGERPEIEEYAGRYPQIATVLRHVLPALQALRAPARDPALPSAAPASEQQTLGCLGDYRIVGELGRGGMGVVYEAVQISLARRVALKVLPFAAALDAKQLQRFKNEAQAAAHLHHTNIVPVYGVGCERGVHYFAMQLIEGQTLATMIRGLRQLAGVEPEAEADAAARLLASDLASGRWAPERPSASDDQPTGPYAPPPPALGVPAAEMTRPVTALSTEYSARNREFFRSVVTLGVQAAEALEHAHQMGVVHRDVKPANLLVDARGNLWITDFGLAHCQSQVGLTMTGDLVGTLRYMSPEQALAQRVLVDHRTDVYSLGATLYELLTLEPAFPGRDRQELLRQIAFEEPRPPRRLNPAIPVELETIVLKAMAKNPDDRYGTAQELADDLKRFAEDKPIRARRVGLGKRVLLWIRRRPAAAALVGVSGLAALTVACLIVFLVFNARLQTALGETETARQNEEQARKEAERFRYFNHIALAGVAWRASNMGRLEQLLDDCPPDYRHHWEWRYLKRQCHGGSRTLRGHDGGVASLAFSPDGALLITGGLDGTAKLWDTTAGTALATLTGHAAEICRVAFGPGGDRVASASADKTVKVWDLKSRQPLFALGHASDVFGLAFSRDGKRLATGGFDKRVTLWDADTGRKNHDFPGHDKEVYSVAFSPDGRRLASGGYDHLVRLWDTTTGREALRPLRGHEGLVHKVAFSPDGKRLASSSVDKTIRLWDAATGELLQTLNGHTAEPTAVAFRPDGKQLASAGGDCTIKVWDAATGQELRTLKGHANMIYELAFSPDGARIASASQDGTVMFWDGGAGQEAHVWRGHAGEVAGVAFSPDGRRVASAGEDGTVKLWDAATGEIVTTCRDHQGAVAGVAFSPDGRWLASAGADQTVKVREAATGKVVFTFTGHKGEVRSVAFSPDGKRIASADAGGTLKVWEPTTGHEFYSGKQLDGEIRSVAFSADGTRLAAAGSDRTVKFVDLTTRQALPGLTGHHCWVHGLAFSPDDRLLAAGGRDTTPAPEKRSPAASRLASVSGDGTVKIWQAATGQLLFSIAAHSGYVRGVAFNRDGTRLATASTDGTVKLWDVRTGQEVLSLKAQSGGVVALAFSPDGNLLTAGTSDGAVQVWDARPWRDQP